MFGWFLNVSFLRVPGQFLFVCLVGFLTAISRTGPKTDVWQVHVLLHTRRSGETMTSVSAGHIILTLTQPVRSGQQQWESNPGPPKQESSALPTEVPACRFMLVAVVLSVVLSPSVIESLDIEGVNLQELSFVL